MGKSGESYLVGHDYRIRFDSLLDPDHRSVAASFSGSIESKGINTESVLEALAGNPGTKVITNALGNKVLSAYTPIDVNGITWALLAEVNEAEDFASSEKLKWLILVILVILVILLVSITLIVTFGVVMASRISKPLTIASLLAKKVASGDLSSEITVERQDEIGDLQGTLKNKNDNLKVMVPRISLSAQKQASAAEELFIITQQTWVHIQNQNEGTEQVEKAIHQMSNSLGDVNSSPHEAKNAAHLANKEAQTGSVEVKNTISSIHTFSIQMDHMTETLSQVKKGANDVRGLLMLSTASHTKPIYWRLTH
jgi:methyl-accepting chemotaxis protein